MGRWLVIGTLFQLIMVIAGHFATPVANLFGPLGMAISLAAGLLWARSAADSYGRGALGGALVGGGCALLGILVSLALGDVSAAILALGTVSSAVTGAIGGLVGRRFASAR